MAKVSETQKALNSAYTKELRRLQRFIKSASNKGFIFPETAIPKTPKKVTSESVAKLQKITSETLYSKAHYRTENNEIISANSFRKRGKKSTVKISSGLSSKTSISVPKIKDKKPAKYKDWNKEQQKEWAKKIKTTEFKAEYKRIKKPKEGKDYLIFTDKYGNDIYFLKRTESEKNRYLASQTKTKKYQKEQLKNQLLDDILDGKVSAENAEYILSGQSKKIRREFYEAQEAYIKGNFSFRNVNVPLQEYETLKRIREMISSWSPMPNWSTFFTDVKRKDKDVLSRLLEGRISALGEETIARILEANAERAISLGNYICYDSKRETIDAALSEFASIINGGAISQEDAKELSILDEMWSS